MAKPYEVSLVANTKGFVAGLGDAESAVEGIGTSLDDAAQDAQRNAQDMERSVGGIGSSADKSARDLDQATEKMGDSVKDAAKETDTATERMAASFKEAARNAQDSGRQIGKGFTDGTDKAKEGLNDFKSESASTAKESAASFDGSADSIIDAFQEVAANAFIGFGPAGLIAGLAAAAGIGLISKAIGDSQEDAETFKAEVQSLAEEFIATGDTGTRSIEFISDALRELATSTEDGTANLQKMKEAADGSGGSFRDLAEAYAGNGEGLDDLISKQEAYVAALEDEQLALDMGTDAGIKRYSEISKILDSSDAYLGYLDEAKEKNRAAAEAEANWVAAGGEELQLKAAAVDAYQDALDDSIASFEDFKNAETGVYDPAAYIAGMAEKAAATQNFNANVQTISSQFGLSIDETQAILDQGVSFGPMLQSIIDSGLAPEFVGQIQSAVGGGQDILDGTPLSATVTADVEPSDKTVKAFTDAKRETKPIEAKAETKAAEAALKAVADKNYKATIGVSADTGDASAAINRLVNKSYSVTVRATVVDQYGRKLN